MKQYVLGCTIIDKITNETIEGVYVIGRYSLAVILSETLFENKYKEEREKSKLYISIFDDITLCEKYCRALSRLYRTDDTELKNPKQKSKKIRRFYPLRLNSSHLKWLKDVIDLKEVDHEKQMRYNEYGENTKDSYPVKNYKFK